MVNASRMLFSIPGSNNKWTDSLESIRCSPQAVVEVKEVVGTPIKYKFVQRHGRMTIADARVKFC
jgi:hypothetical protein